MFSILGAGISGISAGYHLALQGKDHLIYEKRDRWGGLCDNFNIDGFRFDYCVHLSFTKNDYVKKLFGKSAEYNTHEPNPNNYYHGIWLKHPVQNNLFNLPKDQKKNILISMIENRKNDRGNPKNYYEWLMKQYGELFTDTFPAGYTKKYWTVDSKELSIDWVKDRMYVPDINEMILGAEQKHTPVTYYAKEMRYPKEGGYRSFLNELRSKSNIMFNKEIYEVDTVYKKLKFNDGSVEYYEKLISSLPLPEIINMIKDVPLEIKKMANRLSCSEIDLVSIGFKRPDVAKRLWFYIYDEDILPARAYSPNLKSLNNVPEGCSSLQFETYSSKHKPLPMSKENLMEHIVASGIKMNIFSKDDIKMVDHRNIKYGNVIFLHDTVMMRKKIIEYLSTKGIKVIGRFGKWDYLWSDQSFLSGKYEVSNV